ncbi:flavin reductase (DIM6/NTAB) family NADH-FMN oxidoreductase RutF [Elusimicrobium posterum]|uniref:flavin reductase family protein n=1 Tax=Elusimicrobium posterum TaxID=3116653 RepID=UPI003C78BADC
MEYAKIFANCAEYFNTNGAFLSVEAEGELNTMTVSWGFVGFFWQKPYMIVGVRPQRFTKHIMDKAQSFTVSVPYGTMKEELITCGTKSGRDISKAQVVKFVAAKKVSSPVVEGCNAYFECDLTNIQQLDPTVLPPPSRRFIKMTTTTFTSVKLWTVMKNKILTK